MGINDKLSTFFAAGFYYKTFMWPKSFWEKLYEPIIRHAAGLGSVTREEDPDDYDKGFLHCDLLVIGAGPTGLMAALTAGRAGKRVILADEDFRMGGRLNAETFAVGQAQGADWAAGVVAELASLPNVRLMTRTTVIGAFDHGIYGAVERVSDHLAVPRRQAPAGAVAHLCDPRDPGGRRDRTPHRLREQRPARHHAGGRASRLCEPLGRQGG
jgi:NADPH-dependent 2,4-dienoyl-CoA reductase/sulfur reductase-like enzyme